MESIYSKYKNRGLRILAFPANNFGGQEPLPNAEIKKFCRVERKATFDLFAKVSVKGDDICPLYQYLTTHVDKKIAGDVEWNFQKYLVDRKGNVVGKFSPTTLPEDEKLVAQIESLLDAKDGTD